MSRLDDTQIRSRIIDSLKKRNRALLASTLTGADKDQRKRVLGGNSALKLNSIIGLAGQGEENMILDLVDAGLDVNIAFEEDGPWKNTRQFTLLEGATKFGSTDLMRQLCERGADPNFSLSEDGVTILHGISGRGHDHVERVKLLLEFGAFPSGLEGKTKYTPLVNMIVRNTSIEVINILIQAGAKIEELDYARHKIEKMSSSDFTDDVKNAKEARKLLTAVEEAFLNHNTFQANPEVIARAPRL